jgi:4-hydroxy-tetrahydrodipicolinate synthase
VLKNSVSRKAAYIPDASSVAYIKELNDRILKLVEELKTTANDHELQSASVA